MLFDPPFRSVLTPLVVKECHNLSLTILRLLSLGLRIPKPGSDEFDGDYLPNLHAYEDPSGDTFRLLRYPAPRPEWTEKEAAVRIGSHSDFGSVSLVFSDSTGGLQLLSPQTGEWTDVPPLPGAIIVNLGDLISFWTRGYLRSTLHRVTQVPSAKERYAVAYFCRPGFEMRLSAIPSLLLGNLLLETTDKEAPKERDVSAGEWLKARVAKSIGGAGGLPSGY